MHWCWTLLAGSRLALTTQNVDKRCIIGNEENICGFAPRMMEKIWEASFWHWTSVDCPLNQPNHLRMSTWSIKRLVETDLCWESEEVRSSAAEEAQALNGKFQNKNCGRLGMLTHDFNRDPLFSFIGARKLDFTTLWVLPPNSHAVRFIPSGLALSKPATENCANRHKSCLRDHPHEQWRYPEYCARLECQVA